LEVFPVFLECKLGHSPCDVLLIVFLNKLADNLQFFRFSREVGLKVMSVFEWFPSFEVWDIEPIFLLEGNYKGFRPKVEVNSE